MTLARFKAGLRRRAHRALHAVIDRWEAGKFGHRPEPELVHTALMVTDALYDDYTDRLGTNVAFPHCDSLILHRPGTCEYCDRRPDWQQLRSAQGIAFSNDSADTIAKHNLVPCPSTARRPAEVRDLWGGNIATPAKVTFS